MESLREFLWAKSDPRKSLYTHMYEAAVTIRLLMTDSIFASYTANIAEWLNLAEEETIRLLMYLAALHDLGKLHPCFQKNTNVAFAVQFFEEHPEYIDTYLMEKDYRHEKGTCSAVKRIWETKKLFDRPVRKALANSLLLHHQGKSGKDYRITPDEDWDHPEWIELQEELEQKFRDWLQPPQVQKKQIRQMDASCTILTALIILTDWIVSSEVLSMFSEPVSEEETEKNVKVFLKSSGMETCPSIPGKHIFDVWTWLTEESMRPMQKVLDSYLSAKEKMPLLMILEAPMGEGKTEAGIYAALRMASYWKKSGVYVGLPTAATANQMQSRINSLLEAHGIGHARLLHSMAWLEETEDRAVRDTDGEYSDWLKPTKRALLAPWAVGTIDQVMMAVLQVKYGVLRLLGLSGKVLVLDEIHAYDAYMSSIIKRLLEWCKVLRIPVIMMSATLPEEKRRELLSIYTDEEADTKGYPLISAVYEDESLEQIAVAESHQKRTVAVKLWNMSVKDSESISEKAARIVADGGCLCILVNTVKAAQEIYLKLKQFSYADSVYLFHSRFTAARRKEIEEECIRLFGPDHSKRPKRAILVATQVVEQSLDLDFDAMITEIAPIDLLLQRSGRLHRHQDTIRPNHLNEPQLNVLIPPERAYGGTEVIYYPIFLNRTADLLTEISDIRIPEDIPGLVNEVYQTDTVSPEEMDTFWEQQFQSQMLGGQAEAVELESPSTEEFTLVHNSVFSDDESNPKILAKTRFCEESAKVAILPAKLYQLVNDRNGILPSELAKQVMLYCVSVRRQTLISFQRMCGDSTQEIKSGKLAGVFLYCASEETIKPNETICVQLQNGFICADRELGLLMEKEGEKV